MDYPCSWCQKTYSLLDDLYNHVLREHSSGDLANTLVEHMDRQLTKKDFVQVDSHWIYVVDGFHLSLAPNDEGDFKLMVYGTVEPIPPATVTPSEPEWEKAMILANKFIAAYNVASYHQE